MFKHIPISAANSITTGTVTCGRTSASTAWPASASILARASRHATAETLTAACCPGGPALRQRRAPGQARAS